MQGSRYNAVQNGKVMYNYDSLDQALMDMAYDKLTPCPTAMGMEAASEAYSKGLTIHMHDNLDDWTVTGHDGEQYTLIALDGDEVG
jgi:hypothetical protein